MAPYKVFKDKSGLDLECGEKLIEFQIAYNTFGSLNDKKDNVISTLLLSNNLVNILASSLATAFFYDLFGVEGIFYATLIKLSSHFK